MSYAPESEPVFEEVPPAISTGKIVGGMVAIAAVALLWMTFHEPPLRASAGMLGDPEQEKITETVLPGPTEFTITATDTYRMTALVLSRDRYRSGVEAELSPVDLALGWGPVAQEPNLSAVEYSQEGRWYWFKPKDPAAMTIAPAEIPRYSANTHIIPEWDNATLRDEILGIERGDTVELEGYLVRIARGDGWRWVSSRSRTDRDGGSCEIFYVTAARKVYE